MDPLVQLLIFVLIAAVIIAVVWWLMDYLPIDSRLKMIIQGVLIAIILILFLMRALPMLGVRWGTG